MNNRILTLKAIEKGGKWKWKKKAYNRKSFVFFLWRLYYPSLTQQLERASRKSEKTLKKLTIWKKRTFSMIQDVFIFTIRPFVVIVIVK